MITYLLVIGPVAGFLLGVFVTTMCMAAKEADTWGVDIDLSGAAARGDLDAFSEESHEERVARLRSQKTPLMDRIGRTSADDPRGGRTW